MAAYIPELAQKPVVQVEVVKEVSVALFSGGRMLLMLEKHCRHPRKRPWIAAAMASKLLKM